MTTRTKTVLISIIFMLLALGYVPALYFAGNLQYQAGYQNGQSSGYHQGFNQGHSQGYTAGEKDGNQTGYASGYSDGQLSFENFVSYLENACTKQYNGYYQVVVWIGGDGQYHYDCLVG